MSILDKKQMTEEDKEILAKYAKEHGFVNCEFYVDDGFSGTNFVEVR